MDHKRLFIPYEFDKEPKIVIDEKDYNNCDGQTEGYVISPELTLLCKGTFEQNILPNPHLHKYGVNFPGACLIIKEIDQIYVDVDDDLYDKLEDIFKKDSQKREEYILNFLTSV